MKPFSLNELAGFLGELIFKLEDEGDKPHVVIQNGPEVRFPPHLASSPEVTFNLTSSAIGNLFMDEEGMSFQARFNGKVESIFAPLQAIKCVFGKLSGKQFLLSTEASDSFSESTTVPQHPTPTFEAMPVQPPAKGKPKLTLLKGEGKGDGKPRGKLQLVT